MNDFTLLYVEDNEIIQKLVLVILRKYFKKIYIADNGKEGIRIFKEKKPDIVLADISMPTMDGFSMIEKIKKINPNQKIALFTGYNNTSYLNQAINMGVNKYILKPLKPKDMLNALNEIIQSLKIEKEQTQYKKQLEFASRHDELTGLFKRNFFYSKLETLMKKSFDMNRSVAIMSIDLNLFKNINDTYGHDAGDAVLKRVAENLLNSTRKEDIVARFGGDEFAVAIGYIKEAKDIFSFLNRVEHTLLEPLIYKDKEYKYRIPISLSIGITFCSKNENNLPIKELLKQSDKAMYQAKISKKRYSFYSCDENFKEKNTKVKKIKKAIKNREFMLYYQPILDIESNKIIGFESLIRWNHPKKGLLTPDKFLPPILEDSETMCRLGEWIIESAFKQFQKWREKGYSFLISINISSQEFESKRFLSMLKKMLKKYPKVIPQKIILEIVEGVVLKDIEVNSSSISKIKELGFQITLDNFGTGYSTISSFNQFKVDNIKIDKKFVISMLENNKDQSMVKASIQLAKVFGYNVIAEGVESKEHLPALLKLGCNKAQGYGIAKPMPPQEIESLL